ncbi:uncharacterized protein LOC133474370 isoform X6 [Phyllopteryx taeniolatus]|uniref:uncharacterized protein LOC133474370 isoform X6 n=1 Tax=Phyllopteryx taeniolatus TaxID=161469 RepID=UPI002AD25DB6|nr:uncharacterized protein LOC133474370 isoform X6 [Phyllopteryx taeniolatus]
MCQSYGRNEDHEKKISWSCCGGLSGDGRDETAGTGACRPRLPTSIMPWRTGRAQDSDSFTNTRFTQENVRMVRSPTIPLLCGAPLQQVRQKKVRKTSPGDRASGPQPYRALAISPTMNYTEE